MDSYQNFYGKLIICVLQSNSFRMLTKIIFMYILRTMIIIDMYYSAIPASIISDSWTPFTLDLPFNNWTLCAVVPFFYHSRPSHQNA